MYTCIGIMFLSRLEEGIDREGMHLIIPVYETQFVHVHSLAFSRMSGAKSLSDGLYGLKAQLVPNCILLQGTSMWTSLLMGPHRAKDGS